MATIRVEVQLPVPPEVVWADISRLGTHAEWMADAESIEFLTESHEGTGTRIRVATRVGPFRTSDEMEFTAWEPPRLMAVSHQGLFTGEGRFVCEPTATGTRFRWEETIRFPWYLGGSIGAWIARPVLAAIWRRNLHRLAERLSAR
ncbi:MAG: SRPBCC family protein [Acidimicrobiia bacterium]|nr:SRPBCC family protein [Acidimicrobiia bacterium]